METHVCPSHYPTQDLGLSRIDHGGNKPDRHAPYLKEAKLQFGLPTASCRILRAVPLRPSSADELCLNRRKQ